MVRTRELDPWHMLIPVFTQVEDKKRTLHKLRKALMQGRFFYVVRLSRFTFWRINGSAPRHSILDLVTIIITSV